MGQRSAVQACPYGNPEINVQKTTDFTGNGVIYGNGNNGRLSFRVPDPVDSDLSDFRKAVEKKYREGLFVIADGLQALLLYELHAGAQTAEARDIYRTRPKGVR